MISDGDFKKDKFAIQVLSRGSFIDDSITDRKFLVETITFRLNPVALNGWLSSETTNHRDCYDTHDEWQKHKNEYAAKRLACEREILEALGMDPDTKHVSVLQVMSEIFVVLHIKGLSCLDSKIIREEEINQ